MIGRQYVKQLRFSHKCPAVCTGPMKLRMDRHSLDPSVHIDAKLGVEHPFRKTEYLVSRVVKEKAPLMVRDVTKEEGYLYPELATKEGVKGLVSVPMIYREHVIGVINVYSAEARAFSSEDVRVLTAVADQAALAFENTKLSVAVQETQEALQTRKLVERAKSILQKHANLSEEEAYKRLQQQSMRTRKSMREIAEAVLLAGELEERAEKQRG